MPKNEPIQIIRLYDPAFEAIAWDDVRPYALSRDPDDVPPLPPGMSPVAFHARLLTRSQVKWVEQGTTSEERHSRAFLCGVVKVDGGRFGDGWIPSHAGDAKKLAMDEAELDDQRLSRLDEDEIGQVIYKRSVVPFDCSVRYQLLPTSLAAFDGNAHRCAARTRRDAPPSSAPPKDG